MLVIVLHELTVLFVDRKVGQMHEFVVQLRSVVVVGLRGKSDKTVIVHIDF